MEPVYLNNAASSWPKPEKVLTAVQSCLRDRPYHEGRSAGEGRNPVLTAREILADFFHSPSVDSMIFTSGATESLNLILRGLDLSGKHVITTVTEHNSVIRPLMRLQDQRNTSVTWVECDQDGFVQPEAISGAIRADTAAIVLNHGSNVTGVVQDIDAIGGIAAESGIPFIVDAAQSAGLVPIDIQKSRIDALAFTGHKSLWGIPGSGGLYINPELACDPLKTGGTGVRSDLLRQPTERPLLYESGTPGIPGIVSMTAGLEYIREHGQNDLLSDAMRHFVRVRSHLETLPGVQIFSPQTAWLPVLSFRFENQPVAETGYILEESFRIIVRTGLHCAPMIHSRIGSSPAVTVRMSFSHRNTSQEIDRTIEAMTAIAEMVRES